MELFILCLKIFLVRILDVSLGTVRTIVLVKGRKIIATIIGFIEVFIWFVIVREALNTPEASIFIAISYALGFASGTFIGSILSDKLISGTLSVQVVTEIIEEEKMVDLIRKEGYAVSVMDIRGHEREKEKHMLFIEIDKKRLNQLQILIKKLDSKAFIVVNETKLVLNGFIK